MAFKTNLGRGIWGGQGTEFLYYPYTSGVAFPLSGLTGFNQTYSPTNNRNTSIWGDRWTLSFWFKIEGNQTFINNWTTYNGKDIDYSQNIVCRLGGPHIFNTSGSVIGTDYIRSQIHLTFFGSSTTNHNIRILYQPTLSQGNVQHSIGPYQPGKWYNLTIGYNVTYGGVANRFVARLVAQDGSTDTVEDEPLSYGTSGSPQAYRTFGLDYNLWGLLYQTLSDGTTDYSDQITSKPTGNTIATSWDRIFLDTYSLSDTVIFEDYFNSTNRNQNLVVPTNNFAPLMGSAYGDVYPLDNNQPAYYLFKTGTEFGDNTNLPGQDLTFNSSLVIQDSEGPRTGFAVGSANIASDFTATGTGDRFRGGSALLQAESAIIAASGRTYLAQASLSSDFATDAEYIDSSYFDEVYVAGFLDADVILGANVVAQSTSEIAATGNVDYSVTASLESRTETYGVPGLLLSGEASLSAEFAQTAVAGYLQSANTAITAETSVDSITGVILGFAADLPASSELTALGGLIIDIGVQYAYDWVQVEDDYVTPYYYLGIQADSNLSAQALVVKQSGANIQAESTITGTGGKFLVAGNVLMGAESLLQMQQFETGTSAGVIIGSAASSIAADTEVTNITGLLFDINSQIASEFSAAATGSRTVPFLLSNFASDFSLPDVQTEVVTGGQCWVTMETQLSALAGYFHPASADLFTEFTLRPTPVRLINIDEYYIDLVATETRYIPVVWEPRTHNVITETGLIRVNSEPYIMTTVAETRRIKPEPGSAYLQGRRTRRVAI